MNDRDLVLSQIRQRLEILYQMVEELETGGGGEPGTTNYNDLSNKPSVNGHTLIGAKTSSDLDLQPVISDLSTIRSGAAAGATAVQPATMNQALSGKQDTLTFDTTPTSGSTNPVTSGGVYTSLTTKVDKVAGKGLSTNDFTNEDKAQISANKAGIGAVAALGAKNNANFNFGGVVPNANIKPGTIVCTEDNGVFSFSGAADDKNYAAYILKQFLLKAGTYKISGISGGSNTTYWMRIGTGTTDAGLFNLYDGERELNLVSDTLITIQFVIYANQTVSNLVIEPMIRPAAIEDDSYQPYAMTNAELTKNILNKQDILLYVNRSNTTTYIFNGLTNIPDSTHFKYGILIGGGAASNPGKVMIWHVFINTSETVFFTKIIGDDTMTLTGSISDGVLTITSSATIYGGLRLIWLG